MIIFLVFDFRDLLSEVFTGNAMELVGSVTIIYLQIFETTLISLMVITMIKCFFRGKNSRMMSIFSRRTRTQDQLAVILRRNSITLGRRLFHRSVPHPIRGSRHSLFMALMSESFQSKAFPLARTPKKGLTKRICILKSLITSLVRIVRVFVNFHLNLQRRLTTVITNSKIPFIRLDINIGLRKRMISFEVLPCPAVLLIGNLFQRCTSIRLAMQRNAEIVGKM